MPHPEDPAPFFPAPPPAEIYGFIQNPADLTDGSDSEDGDHDIYRGSPPTPAPPRSPSPRPSTSSSSSSSSSGISLFGGRLGAISAGVEHAISRWARAWTSTSSLSSSSSSSASVVTQSKSQTPRRRRRRPRSIATTIHNALSEREIAARIRAREDLRNVPRTFVLYAPRLSIVGAKSQAAAERKAARAALHDPILRTTHLHELTARLGAVLRERARARRPRLETVQTRAAAGTVAVGPALQTMEPSVHQDYMLSDESDVARATSGVRGPAGKGKQKLAVPESTTRVPAPAVPPPVAPLPPGKAESESVTKAWWLDVVSPTWEDMCAIGKLLHLHPLTLEDILTQDPREKLELFPKLGYYFISFRAVESQKTRDRVRNLLSQDDAEQHDSGVVGQVNVYLVVFPEGICSFHFSDIDEHVNRVRDKIMLLGDSMNASSKWIAHGLMSSIVDAFFPYLEIVEKEVLEIERLVFSTGGPFDWPQEELSAADSSQTTSKPDTLLREKNGLDSDGLDEKKVSVDLGMGSTKSMLPKPRFSSPTSIPLLIRRARRHILDTIASIPRFKAIDREAPGYNDPSTTVHRMTRVRRLVTSLTRFLAVKSDVVAQVRKRLLTTGEWSLGNGTGDDLDVFVYMGDVQDRILTLQQSLAHYERMLSQSHPTYLSQLRTSVNQAKSGSDKAVVSMTTLSLGVLCVQTLIGLFSMNAQVPHNDLDGNSYNVFGIVISLGVVITFVYSSVVRRWWRQAKRHRLSM